MTKHLWEIDHPYYGPDSCYWARPADESAYHQEHESWADFREDGFYDADEDMNLLYRWDWLPYDPDEYDEETEAHLGLPDTRDTLKFFWMLQRKGIMASSTIRVSRDSDEAEIREWLAKKAAHMARLWEPFLEVTS